MTLDATIAAQADAIIEPGFLARRPAPGAQRWRAWLCTEEATMRALYPSGGAEAVHQALPHRAVTSIRSKAQKLGLRCKKPSTQGKRFARLYPLSEYVDNVIRQGYAAARNKGDYGRIAETLNRPAWWVHRRAATLCLTHNSRTRLDAWTADERALLERWGSCTTTVIRRKLAAAGFERTETAIACKLKRLQIDRDDPDRWSPGTLAQVLGVNAATIVDWIERRDLPATKDACGKQVRYTIDRKGLRGWIRTHQRYIDLRKVDQPWFMDLVFGSAAT